MSRKEIQAYWLNLVEPYLQDMEKIYACYREIVDHYSDTNRKYHNLDHIETLLNLTVEYGHRLESHDVVRFAVFYHDIIYHIPGADNEEKSAALAEKRMASLYVSPDVAKLVTHLILCTKNHKPEPCMLQNDLSYFLDFDLSILGSSENTYAAYTEAIRKEYWMYPGFLYKPGRKKVIRHFLQKEHIFLTPDLRHRFEQQARKNLQNELEAMNND